MTLHADAEINGNRACTVDTMELLERAGLVSRPGAGAWEPTEAGRQCGRT